MMDKRDLPPQSSGRPWTRDEEDRLYQELLALTLKFPGRSLAAVVTRIAYLQPLWGRRDTR